MVPLLTLLLGFDTKIATATSLAAIIVTATVGVITHGSLGNVDWGYALLIGLPAVAGVLIGVWVKARVSTRALAIAFAGLLAGVAMWLVSKPADGGSIHHLTAGRGALVAVLGLSAGVLAGLFGVGGGILFVPALTLIVGLPQILAEGTSLLAIIPVALVGSWRQHREGTVRWAAAGVMGAASVVTAIIGAFVADATPGRTLRVLFAILMIATATQLAVRAWRSRAA